jgi:competence protein ComEA
MLRTLLSSAALLAVLAAQSTSIAAQAAAGAGEVKPSGGAIVNLNTATAKDLEVLPGIGAKTAARIVEYRQKNGPFKKIEDLMNVSGIGEKSFLKLKPQLTVAAARPQSPAESTR